MRLQIILFLIILTVSPPKASQVKLSLKKPALAGLTLKSSPIDYRKEIMRFIEKEKYDKALKVCNTAIKENKYDFLYNYRSQVKEKLGDTEGSEKDRLTSVGINDQVMVVINIDVRGVTRKVMVGSEVTRISY